MRTGTGRIDSRVDEMEKLMSISSSAIECRAPDRDLLIEGTVDLYELLAQKNGFYAFESALHVFPSARLGVPGRSLEEWNSPTLWKQSYGELLPPGLFFAEDIFGGQFLLSGGSIHRFDQETAETAYFASSIGEWETGLLADYGYCTGYPLGHEWQTKNGSLPVGYRLVPRIPFVCGGAFESSNLIQAEAGAVMRYWAEFALEVSQVPDGEQIRFDTGRINMLESLKY
jgi:hypothetical protein